MELDEIDRLLAAAKRPEKEVQLCLRGDLQATWEKLDAELRDLKDRATETLAGNTEAEVLSARIRDIQAEMRDATLTVTLQAMSRVDWKLMLAAHPPREGNLKDQAFGANDDTIWDDLIRRSIVAPVLDQDRAALLLDGLSSRQYDDLANTAWALNRQDVSVPFSVAASQLAPSSGGMSRQRSGSGSRTNGSADGSRKKSPNSSTKLAG